MQQQTRTEQLIERARSIGYEDLICPWLVDKDLIDAQTGVLGRAEMFEQQLFTLWRMLRRDATFAQAHAEHDLKQGDRDNADASAIESTVLAGICADMLRAEICSRYGWRRVLALTEDWEVVVITAECDSQRMVMFQPVYPDAFND